MELWIILTLVYLVGMAPLAYWGDFENEAVFLVTIWPIMLALVIVAGPAIIGYRLREKHRTAKYDREQREKDYKDMEEQLKKTRTARDEEYSRVVALDKELRKIRTEHSLTLYNLEKTQKELQEAKTSLMAAINLHLDNKKRAKRV